MPVPRPLVRSAPPSILLAALLRPNGSRRQRLLAGSALVGLWTAVYLRYRRAGREQTRRERALMATIDPRAFSLHYNERVPTVDEEFALWGAYHQHRHEMRYDLVAVAARQRLPPGGVVLDVGCGAALVADRLSDLPARYVGLDFGGHHIAHASKRLAGLARNLSVSFVRGNGEQLPLAADSVDVVVLSEVIEHLIRPERAVWELARVLRPGGVLVMTTNNASEAPLRSPLAHAFVWIEKMLGADHPRLVSLRPWVWPEPVDRELLGLADEEPDVYVPHTHHIQAETRRLFSAAGLDVVGWSTFEFPPPQSATSAWLESKGDRGQRIVDRIEAVATRTPGLRRLGSHLLMEARKTGSPVAPTPATGVWPGPFSGPA